MAWDVGRTLIGTFAGAMASFLLARNAFRRSNYREMDRDRRRVAAELKESASRYLVAEVNEGDSSEQRVLFEAALFHAASSDVPGAADVAAWVSSRQGMVFGFSDLPDDSAFRAESDITALLTDWAKGEPDALKRAKEGLRIQAQKAQDREAWRELKMDELRLEAEWNSMTSTKTYLTGAIGSRFIGEAFGDSYELPPDLAYGETCATIGNIMLSWRLLLATGESRFADAIERALYNLFAASTAIDRKGFFYNNPAQRRTALAPAPTDTRPSRADAPGTRPAWFECACCPPNVMRMVASLASYLSTSTDGAIQLHQYMPSTIDTEVEGIRVRLAVATEYPVRGTVSVTIVEASGTKWGLDFRIPDWADGASLSVNGTPATLAVSALGYARLVRAWSPGDVVTLELPIEPRLTVVHPSVDAVRGAVAIERGPVVYAFESVDQAPGVDLNHVEILRDADITADPRQDLLGQPSVVLRVRGRARRDEAWAGTGWKRLSDAPVSDGEDVDLVAIPYALWANRGPSVMRIFVPLAV
jgi:DUF1680 family protein